MEKMQYRTEFNDLLCKYYLQLKEYEYKYFEAINGDSTIRQAINDIHNSIHIKSYKITIKLVEVGCPHCYQQFTIDNFDMDYLLIGYECPCCHNIAYMDNNAVVHDSGHNWMFLKKCQ